jgi:hypothetical protein
MNIDIRSKNPAKLLLDRQETSQKIDQFKRRISELRKQDGISEVHVKQVMKAEVLKRCI